MVCCLRCFLIPTVALSGQPEGPVAEVTYKVWSTYPPALYTDPSGRVRIVAGTVYKVMVGKNTIPITQSLPASTTLSQMQWMRPVITPTINTKPTTTRVQGSGGKTYIVTTYTDGKRTCTCPGYTYRRSCKHTT